MAVIERLCKAAVRDFIKITSLLVVSGCVAFGGIRQSDLDAWIGQPVEALETQPFFLSLPLEKRMLESGVEVRNYKNISNRGIYGVIGCNNIFYIKDKIILEYAPTGQCRTDERVLPSNRRY